MNEIVTRVATPDSAVLTNEAEQMLAIARDMVIDSPQMLDLAGIELQAIKRKAQQWEAQRKAITVPLDDVKRTVMALFRPGMEYLEQAEQAIKGSIATYTRKIEAERRAAAAAAEEAARKEAARLAALALKQEAAGKVEKAAETAARAEAAAMVSHAPVEAPKAAGVSMRRVYKARVTDKAELLRFVLANPMFVNLIEIDESALNALARAQRDAFALPGCQLVVEDVVASRAS